MHNAGLMLLSLTVGATTQGDGMIGWITSYGVQAIVGLIGLAVVVIGIALFRRTNANSRGSDKKF